MVHVAGHILLYGPIQFKVVLVVKMFWDLLPSFLTFIARKGLKLSNFYFWNCVLKPTNNYTIKSHALCA